MRPGAAGLFYVILTLAAPPLVAQGVASDERGMRVEAVNVRFRNPSADPLINARVEDQIRRAVSLFPREEFAREQFEFALSRTRRLADVADASYDISFGPTGGVIVDVYVTLRDAAAAGAARGVLGDGGWKDFPTLYDSDGLFLRARLETLAMYYGNGDAWYSRPDLMLAGNPLVDGRPAGRGYDDWLEGHVHAGVSGIGPVTPSFYVYGSASVMATGSVGQELFTDKTRSYVAWEDAYIGFITGRTSDAGNRFVLNASGGRQRLTLGDGFLIINTAQNGSNRGALQANSRWAADLLAIVQARYNNARFEVFRVDPDEVPVLDTRTVIDGANLEVKWLPSLTTAVSYLEVPKSTASYFTPAGEPLPREGLEVLDLRARWQPRPAGESGPFLAGEVARQTHDDFPMEAWGYFGEVGYSFADVRTTPTVSYRYSRFTGDDAETSRFERWDPLLSGGSGEQWVQGTNHFKVVQDTNVVAHRLMARMRISPRFEIVPQFWIFKADSPTNLGGNPALSLLSSDDYGKEINTTFKVFWSRNLYIHGSVALTFPGDAVTDALDGTEREWWSTMLFARYAF